MQWNCKCGAVGEVEEITASITCPECDNYIVWDKKNPCAYWYTSALDELESVNNCAKGLKFLSVISALFATAVVAVACVTQSSDVFFYNLAIVGFTGLMALVLAMPRKEWGQNAVIALAAAGVAATLAGYFNGFLPMYMLFEVVLSLGALVYSRRKELFKEDAPSAEQFAYLLKNRTARKPVTLDEYNEIAARINPWKSLPMLCVYLFIAVGVAAGGWQLINYQPAEISLADQAAAQQGEVDLNDPQQFFEYCLAGAEAGNTDAMLRLAECYLTGSGTEKDLDKGLQCLLQAAEAGKVEAYSILAIYYSGAFDRSKADARQFFDWSKKAADAGDPNGKVNLAWCYFQGIGCEADPATGVRYAEECATAEPQMLLLLAKYYLGQFSDYQVVDANKAFTWSALAEKAQNPAVAANGKYCLALCYASGYGCEKDEQKAIQLAWEAAMAGDEEARTMIGFSLRPQQLMQ